MKSPKKSPYGYQIHHADKRAKRFKAQRKKRGFDDSELWCLDRAIAVFILPRLKAYKAMKTDGSVPSSLLEGDVPAGANFNTFDLDTEAAMVGVRTTWVEIIQKMIDYFEFVATEKETSDRVPLALREGFDLFHKHYSDLWD